MTSAINGRIIFKQGPRAYLDANIRRNSLVFDTDNNMILYSPSGTTYYEFPSGQTSGGGGSVSGNVPWSNVTNQPIASNSTSGLLSIVDWNKFNNKADLSAVSGSQGISAVSWGIISGIPTATSSTSGVLSNSDWSRFNSKVDVSALSGIGSGSGTVSSVGLSSNTLEVSNSPITSSGTFSVNLSSVISSGTYVKQVIDQYGRTISGTILSISDIPSLSAQYVQVGSVQNASTNTSGYLTSSDWNKFNNKADLSAIPSTSSFVTSSSYFSNPDPVIQLYSGNTTSAGLQNISAATEFPFWAVGYRTKKYTFIGPVSGNYQATIIFQGATHLENSWDNTNSISATITSGANSISEFYTNKLTKWSAQLIIDSGTVPSPGISASVEV